MINLNNETPLVGKWIIKYDEKYQMPQFIQGRIIGNSLKHKNGQMIIINNIESIDLRDNTLKTNDGFGYKLIGAGKRMILLAEKDILEMSYTQVKSRNFITDNEDDDDDDDE